MPGIVANPAEPEMMTGSVTSIAPQVFDFPGYIDLRPIAC